MNAEMRRLVLGGDLEGELEDAPLRRGLARDVESRAVPRLVHGSAFDDAHALVRGDVINDVAAADVNGEGAKQAPSRYKLRVYYYE